MSWNPDILNWSPEFGPSDVLLLLTVLVALFGPRYWQNRSRKQQARNVCVVSIRLLESMLADLTRIRNERNRKADSPQSKVSFDKTSMAEIGHYHHVFSEILVPNLGAFDSIPHKTIEFFDHYKKNIQTLNGRDGPFLTATTVDNWEQRLKDSIEELRVLSTH